MRKMLTTHIKVFAVFLLVLLHLPVAACTIVAVSGRVTADGRPLLLKNRDSGTWDIKIRIGKGGGYKYLSQCVAAGGVAYSGYNEMGFSIINSHSYNMPNSVSGWNAYIMQLALERCATVDEFEYMLDTLTKPISVCSNYGVMDAQGQVAIIEVNSYTHIRFNADDEDCGYLIRTNYSHSQDTTGVAQISPSSQPRYLITSSYLEGALSAAGFITKENLLGLTRCLRDSEGYDLRDIAPTDEYDYTPIDFRYYVPRYKTTSVMIIQGVLHGEQPNLTVAWTAIGSPLATVTVPYLITPSLTLPRKAKKGDDGHSWFCYQGHRLKNNSFTNNTTLDLAKLYNQSCTGVIQKIGEIEEEILLRGNNLVEALRQGTASNIDVEQYYAWIDGYVEEQYAEYNLIESNTNEANDVNENIEEPIFEYYNILGQRVKDVRSYVIIKRSGHIGIILN